MDSDEDELENQVEKKYEEEEEEAKANLSQWLSKFDGGDKFDAEFFRREAVGVLMLLVRLSSRLGETKSDSVTRVNGKFYSERGKTS